MKLNLFAQNAFLWAVIVSCTLSHAQPSCGKLLAKTTVRENSSQAEHSDFKTVLAKATKSESQNELRPSGPLLNLGPKYYLDVEVVFELLKSKPLVISNEVISLSSAYPLREHYFESWKGETLEVPLVLIQDISPLATKANSADIYDSHAWNLVELQGGAIMLAGAPLKLNTDQQPLYDQQLYLRSKLSHLGVSSPIYIGKWGAEYRLVIAPEIDYSGFKHLFTSSELESLDRQLSLLEKSNLPFFDQQLDYICQLRLTRVE